MAWCQATACFPGEETGSWGETAVLQAPFNLASEQNWGDLEPTLLTTSGLAERQGAVPITRALESSSSKHTTCLQRTGVPERQKRAHISVSPGSNTCPGLRVYDAGLCHRSRACLSGSFAESQERLLDMETGEGPEAGAASACRRGSRVPTPCLALGPCPAQWASAPGHNGNRPHTRAWPSDTGCLSDWWSPAAETKPLAQVLSQQAQGPGAGDAP